MLRRLALLLVILALAWSGYWWFGARTHEAAIRGWLDQRAEAGWVANYETLEVSGYPLRFDTVLNGLELADPRAGWAWSAPEFRTRSYSYRPNEFIAIWPPRQKVSVPAETIEITSRNLAASIRFQPDTGLALAAMTMDISALELVSTAGWRSRMESAQLSTSLNAERDFAHDILFSADAMEPSRILRAIVDPAGRLPEVFDSVRLDATLGFDAPWDRHAIEGRKPELTLLDLRTASALWGKLSFEAAGRLEVDGEGYPTGKLDLRARNWREMLTLARESGLLPADVAQTLENGLTILAGFSGDPDTIEAPLVFRDGLVALGPLPLPVERVRIRLNP